MCASVSGNSGNSLQKGEGGGREQRSGIVEVFALNSAILYVYRQQIRREAEGGRETACKPDSFKDCAVGSST